MPYPTQIFQEEMVNGLRRIFPEPTPIDQEWRTITDNTGLYSPRIDIAIGPYSIIRGENQIIEYDRLMDESRFFIDLLLFYHTQNIQLYANSNDPRSEQDIVDFDILKFFNRNARCMFAIEIENRVSRKHLLGGAVNASVLGRIGVIIGWDDSKVKALVKLREYWNFLGNVGKNTFSTDNLLILAPEQFRNAVHMEQQ